MTVAWNIRITLELFFLSLGRSTALHNRLLYYSLLYAAFNIKLLTSGVSMHGCLDLDF